MKEKCRWVFQEEDSGHLWENSVKRRLKML